MRIPFMLISVETGERLSRRFVGIGKKLLGIFPGVRYDLRNAGLAIEPEKYCVTALFSAIGWGVLFLLIGFAATYVRTEGELGAAGAAGGGLFLAFTAIFFLLHVFYPGILARKIAESIDKDLLFALKDMLIQVRSGISLYNAMQNIAASDYGHISKEFQTAVRQISAGESERSALEKIALRTQSEYFKRSIWQLITAMQSGASVEGALRSILDILVARQRQAIRGYSSDLNFLILIYLLFAAVIPSIGVTMLALLSAFSSVNITPGLFAGVAVVSFVVQISLIGAINSSRPEVYSS